MSPDAFKSALLLSKQLLSVIKTDNGKRGLTDCSCYFCGRLPRNRNASGFPGGWRIDKQKYAGASIAVCTLCKGSISRTWMNDKIFACEQPHDRRYGLDEVPPLVLARWFSLQLIKNKVPLEE
tara:strand:+ start:197 stop:565 length:369 start_codon:yes stop_codon:yes gene_type:complete